MYVIRKSQPLDPQNPNAPKLYLHKKKLDFTKNIEDARKYRSRNRAIDRIWELKNLLTYDCLLVIDPI